MSHRYISLINELGSHLDPKLVSVINYCNGLAQQLINLQHWWDTYSLEKSIESDEPPGVKGSCQKLDYLLHYLMGIILNNQSFPREVLNTIFLYASAAAMNFGKRIDWRLESSIGAQRLHLFHVAFEICRRLDPSVQKPL